MSARDKLRRSGQAASRFVRRAVREKKLAENFIGLEIPEELRDAEKQLDDARALQENLEMALAGCDEMTAAYDTCLNELEDGCTADDDKLREDLEEEVYEVRRILNLFRVKLNRWESLVGNGCSRSATPSQSQCNLRGASEDTPFHTTSRIPPQVGTEGSPFVPPQARSHSMNFQDSLTPTENRNAEPQRESFLGAGTAQVPLHPRVPQLLPSPDLVNSEQFLQQLAERTAALMGSHGPTTQGSPGIKLPKLELPRFGGTYSDWQPFWDRFQRAVDQNARLSGADKLSYLLSCLTDDALKLVKSLPATNENYRTAVVTLRKAFGDPTVARESARSKLYDLSPIQTSEIGKLKRFYYEMESSLGSLEALDGRTESEDLLGILMKKLPFGVIASLERAKGIEQEWTLELFRKLLSAEISIRESASRHAFVSDQRGRVVGDQGQMQRKERNSTYRPVYTAQALWSNDKRKQGSANYSSASSPRNPCMYCNGEHFCDECPKFRTVAERREYLRQTNRCFLCLRQGHSARDCRTDRVCFYCRRRKVHHTSVCPERVRGERRASNDQTRLSSEDPPPIKGDLDLTMSELGSLADDEKTIMKTLLIRVTNPCEESNFQTVRVFLDTGSSRSYITPRLAKTLRLIPGNERVLAVDRFGKSDDPLHVSIETTKVWLGTTEGWRCKINVAISDHAMKQMTRRRVPDDVLRSIPQHLRLSDPPASENCRVDVDVMIGNDYFDDMVTGNKIALHRGFWLIETIFGWMVSGRLPDEDVCQRNSGKVIVDRREDGSVADELTRLQVDIPCSLEQFWDLESIGIKDDASSTSDDVALAEFNRTVRYENGRYMVTWPWKPNASELPSNYSVALRRLRWNLARNKKAGRYDYLDRYDAIIKNQLDQGIIEVVADGETKNRIHYLPHHGVETPQKATTKLRIVYDASARESPENVCLNDVLYRGRVFLENLVTLLIRFRLHPIAMVADIEKAFLQVGLQEHQRDVTRFLWVKDVRDHVSSENLVVYRFARVSFGIISSPFLLGATVMHHLKHTNTGLARLIESSIYVDNVVLSLPSTEDARSFYTESKAIFRKAGMNLREYGSNDEKLMSELPAQDKISGDDVKVLGMIWDKSADVFRMRAPKDCKEPVSKRSILSQLFQVYDPLGFTTPVTIRGRILLQRITKLKAGWNETLPNEIEVEWRKLSSDLSCLCNIAVPRYYGSAGTAEQQLMVFCDASKLAYACAVYLQTKQPNDSYVSQLVFSKAKVNPLKQLSIPRLELLAVLIGVRAVRFVKESLSFSGRIILWSDSQSVLHWIGNDVELKSIFIENRIREIKIAQDIEYRYVPSNENPADRATRGVSLSGLDAVWFSGPPWASKDCTAWPEWPKCDGVSDKSAALDCEKKETSRISSDEAPNKEEAPFGIDVGNISCYRSLVRRTALCQRFINKCRKRCDQVDQRLHPEEIRKASLSWIRFAQRTEFAGLLSSLQARKHHDLKRSLGVWRDSEGLLRCSGRLGNMNEDYDTKYPYLLPTKNKVTDLIIMETHRRSLHAGVGQTLAAIRNQFWIPQGRRRVQHILKDCVLCRKHEGGPFERPPMPDLPAARVQVQRPFSNVGLDYLGPVYVKSNQDHIKRWICMFTCLTIRAIHLEVVNDLSAEEFALALQRFISRRGKPKAVISDNASQFKTVKQVNPFQVIGPVEEIEWRFIPQLAPWSGGVYERMVRTVKTAMKKTIGRRLLSHQELLTVMTEVENTVNSRPLTYTGSTFEDMKLLSPNHLLGIPIHTVVPVSQIQLDGQADTKARGDVICMYRKFRSALDQFWQVWRNEYLLSMRESNQWLHKDPENRVRRRPQVGEVVVVKDPGKTRNLWTYGRVHDLIHGTDGAVRAVSVMMPSRRILIRPVSLLYPLECQPPDHIHTDATNKANVFDGKFYGFGTKEKKERSPCVNPRPHRRAKTNATKHIQKIIDYERSVDDG